MLGGFPLVTSYCKMAVNVLFDTYMFNEKVTLHCILVFILFYSFHHVDGLVLYCEKNEIRNGLLTSGKSGIL